MAWLPIGLLVLGILADSALRRGKLGLGWAVVLLIAIQSTANNPRYAEIEKQNEAYAVGMTTAYCLFGFFVYRAVTWRQKVVRGTAKICRTCGCKINLFNRALEVTDLCGKCARNPYNSFIKGLEKLKIGDTVDETLLLIGMPTKKQRDKNGHDRWIYEIAKKGTLLSTIYSYIVVISDNKVVEIIPDSDWEEAKQN